MVPSPLRADRIKAHGLARAKGHDLVACQSNAEHELIGKDAGAKGDGIAFVIINPGAFTHTSIALRDAFLARPYRSSRFT